MKRKATKRYNSSKSNNESYVGPDNKIEDISYKTDYALKVLERTDAWINNCDNKMSVLLGTIGIILTILLTTESISKACGFVMRLFEEVNLHKALFLMALFIVLFFYIITAFHVINTVFARTDSNRYFQKKMSEKSNVFFGSVSKMSYAEYMKHFVHETTEERLNDILSQIYINSVIASEKYKNYNRSLKWTVMSVSLTIVIVIWALVGF